MILPDFVLPGRVNYHWEFNGIDSVELCQNKQHFLNYPYKISYDYNSRGYRDQEWPDSIDQLKTAIWCLGDSFTVGIGSPREHTWAWLLQQQLKNRTINVSLDGASNQWIYRKAVSICQQLQPELIVIHWSYITRSELSDVTLTDEQRRLCYDPKLIDTDYAMMAFQKLVFDLEERKGTTRIIHSFIPDFVLDKTFQEHWNTFSGPDWPNLPATLEQFDSLPTFIVQELEHNFNCYKLFRTWCEICQKIEYVPEFNRLDRARDWHHYDLITAQHFVSGILKLLHG
jgi:hypothetical protein